MKLSILQENLHRALTFVTRAANSKSTLPVLGNVLLATENGRLKLTGTNLELTLTTYAGAKVEQEGAITLPAKTFADFVTLLPPERIDLTLNPKTSTVALKCGTFKSNIKGIDANEYPIIPQFSDAPIATIAARELSIALAQTMIAVSKTDDRPALNGVCFDLSKKKIILAAADGFRLSVRAVEWIERSGETMQMLVPLNPTQELARVLSADGADDDNVEIRQVNNTQVEFRHGDHVIVSSLIDGKFPQYQNIIPQSHTERVSVGIGALRESVRATRVFARDAMSRVSMQLKTANGNGIGHIVVQGISAEIGDALGEIDANIDGDEVEIGMNSDFLLDALNAFGVTASPQVVFELNGTSGPALLLDASDPQRNFQHVIMPMDKK